MYICVCQERLSSYLRRGMERSICTPETFATQGPSCNPFPLSYCRYSLFISCRIFQSSTVTRTNNFRLLAKSCFTIFCEPRPAWQPSHSPFLSSCSLRKVMLEDTHWIRDTLHPKGRGLEALYLGVLFESLSVEIGYNNMYVYVYAS